MDMDGTWFMKKVIVTTILNGKLMVGYFVFTMSSKKKKMKAFLGTYYLLYHKFIINKFSYLKLMDFLKVYFWLKYFKSFGYDI